MPPLRIALAQVDLAVGDLDGNADVIAHWTGQARDAGADLVAFPEMALTGYPPEDLVLRRSFADAAKRKLHDLAARLADEGAGDIAVVVGYLDRADEPTPRLGRPAGEPQNAAAVLFGGEVVAEYAKHHLPNYGVFDEYRYFVPGDRFPVLRLHGIDIGLTVCEDLWQDGGPIHVAHEAGVGLVVCTNGSPYERGKTHTRDDLSARRAKEAGAPLAYVNMVGGQDELVFDGGSLVVTAEGPPRARAGQFDEDLLVADLDLPAGSDDEPPASVDADDGTTMAVRRIPLKAAARADRELLEPPVADRLEDSAELYAACVLGTRDYVRKNGFPSVVLGLSGGIDSALVATIAVDALGADAVHTVALPSAYSSEHSVSDADELARRQGTQHSNVPIASVVDAYQELLHLSGVAEENLQARVRGTALMALSNADGHLVLTTGNKSELATGFSTLYGDSAGGFAPIKDVPKTAVWQLSAGGTRRRRGAGRRSRSRWRSSRRHRPPSSRPASSIPTGSRTTPSSTRSSTATSSATWATRNSARPATRRRRSNA